MTIAEQIAFNERMAEFSMTWIAEITGQWECGMIDDDEFNSRVNDSLNRARRYMDKAIELAKSDEGVMSEFAPEGTTDMCNAKRPCDVYSWCAIHE